MAEFRLSLPSEKATAALGAALAPLLAAGDALCLMGPLGAGKTTFARGLIAALTGGEEAPSPTFALVLTYEASGFTLWHFDLYRLEKEKDAFELGLEEALASGVSLIEWPERIARHIPESALLLHFAPEGAARTLTLRGNDKWARRLRGAGLLKKAESREQGFE